MRKALTLFMLFSGSTFAVETPSNNDLQFGVGLGAQYAGLGANVSFVSESDAKYIALGCVQFRPDYNDATCGASIGYINTSWLSEASNKHGLGIHAGIIGSERTTPNIAFIKHQYDGLYGVGVGYTYFSNGINKQGFTLGASIHQALEDTNGHTHSILFQLGYQF